MKYRDEYTKMADIANKAAALRDEITDENRSAKEAEFTRMMDEHDQIRSDVEARERVDAAQSFLAEVQTETNDETRSVERSNEGENRFNAYLRGQLSDAEVRAMSIAGNSGGKGGALVPTQLMNTIVAAMKDYGPLNEGGPSKFILTSNGSPIDIPTADNTGGTAAVKAENAASTAKDHDIGKKTLTVSTYESGIFQLSQELVDDSVFDIEGFVAGQCGENLGRKVNAAHTATLIAQASDSNIAMAANNVFAQDDFLKLAYSVNGAYARNGAFMYSRATEGVVRLLKDNNGQWLWQPDMQAGEPARIHGYRAYVNDDMPSLGTNSSKVAVFGDFSKFFTRRAGNVTIKVSNDLLMSQNAVAIAGFVRAGSVLVDTNAIKYLSTPAS